MSTIIPNIFSINGVIDTSQNVLQNMNTIASAAGAWVTYDINQGKWAVIINQAGSSISSFNDSNIIGSISVSSTGLTELYNSVEIEFPNTDVLDQRDYIKFEIDAGDRFPNEPDNELQIKMDIINNSVQAELIASRELKQSRVDKVIEFRTDFTKLGLKAGDLIDVTNSALGWTAKVFRIMRIEEEDADDGIFSLSIQALEYNSDVYSTSGLTRTARSISPEIPAKKNNAAATGSDANAITENLTDALGNPLNVALISSLLNALSSNIGSGYGSVVALDTFSVSASTAVVQSQFRAYQPGPIAFNGSPSSPNLSAYVALNFSLLGTVKNLVLNLSVPIGTYDYNAESGFRNDVYAYIPSNYLLYRDGVLLQQNTADWQTPDLTIIISNAAPGNYTMLVHPLPTYDLDQPTTYYVWPYDFTVLPQASGGGVTLIGYAYYS